MSSVNQWQERAIEKAEANAEKRREAEAKAQRRLGLQLSEWLSDVLGVSVACDSGEYTLDGMTFAITPGASGVSVKTTCPKCNAPLTSTRILDAAGVGALLIGENQPACPICARVDVTAAENRVLVLAVAKILADSPAFLAALKPAKKRKATKA